MALGMRTASGETVSVIVPTRYYAHCSDGRKFSLSAAADFIAEAGFDGADVSLDTIPELDGRDGDYGWRSVLFSFGNRAAARGLILPVCHLPFYMPDPDDAAAMARFAREIVNGLRAAALLQVPDAVIHPIVRHGSRCTRGAWLTENLTFLAPLREEAARVGVRLCVENMAGKPYATHPSEAVYGSRAADVKELADRLDMGICWDFGHANLTGLCQSAELEQVGDRLRVVHIHDNDGVKDTHRIPGECVAHTPLGGAVDWDDAAEGLRLCGFLTASNRCLNLELKTSDLPADRSVRLAHAAKSIFAARMLAGKL